MPKLGEVASCSDLGILGVVAGTISLIQATEVVKYLCGIEPLLVNKVLYYHLKEQSTFVLEYGISNEIFGPKNIEELMNTSYEESCADIDINEITVDEFRDDVENYTVVDVRGIQELPKWHFSSYIHIELRDLPYRMGDLPKGNILFICQVGLRSAEAVRIASMNHGTSKRFFNLKGGIQKLIEKI
jgi:adenylyltransferase/sulfurtransferase